MLSKSATIRLVLLMATGTGTLALSSPAQAQADTCDLNGTNGGVNASPADGFAVALGTDSLACGTDASANGDHSAAFGTSSGAYVENAVSIGYGSSSGPVEFSTFFTSHFFEPLVGPTGSTAVGAVATAIGIDTIALGDHALVGEIVETGMGTAIDPVHYGTAIGSHAAVQADSGTAVGASANVTAIGGIAIGRGTAADFDSSIVIGDSSSDVGAALAVAIGNNADAMGIGSIAIGSGLTTGPVNPADPAPLGQGGIAIGLTSSALGRHAISIGGFNVVQGRSSVAMGESHDVSGAGAVALGFNNNATGDGAIALGNATSAAGEGAVAIGDVAVAGTNGVAIGNGASTATFTNSVALGAGSVNTADNQVQVGGRTISGVAAGVAPTDAVNVSQLSVVTGDVTAVQTTVATHTTQITGLQTTTATHTTQIAAIQAVNATQATQISALQAAQDLVQNQVDTLFDLRGRDRRDMKQGVASAMAMAQTLMPSNPGGISYAVNGATFRGEYAVGASFSYRLNTEAPMAISVGASFAGNKNNGVRVGVAGEF